MNCRITEWLRLLKGPLEISWCHPCSSRATQSCAQHYVQVALEDFQGASLHSLPGQPAPLLGHSESAEELPDVQRESLVFWTDPGSVPFALFLQVFMDIDGTPLSILQA